MAHPVQSESFQIAILKNIFVNSVPENLHFIWEQNEISIQNFWKITIMLLHW